MKESLIILSILISTFTYGQTLDEVTLFNEVNEFRKSPKSYIPIVENYIRTQESYVAKVKDGSMILKRISDKSDKENRMHDAISLDGLDIIRERIKAANELLVILDTLVLDTVSFDMSMYVITKIHKNYLDSIKRIDHYGLNGVSCPDRFIVTGYSVGECLVTIGKLGDKMYFKPAIMSLLIDAGIKNRGHRKILIDPNYTHASAGIGSYTETLRGFTLNTDYCIINLGE
jgi:hypothetical protein